MPCLTYGVDACCLTKSQLNSIDFVINRLFMKLFKTNNTDIVKYCQYCFSFEVYTQQAMAYGLISLTVKSRSVIIRSSLDLANC